MIATALFFVLLPAAFLSFVLKKRIEYFIGGILPFWGILLYLGGMCRIFDLTYRMIVFGIWLSLPIWLGIVVYGVVKKKKTRDYLCRVADMIATPGCLLFIIAVALSKIVCDGRCFTRWDEFSHWGRIVYVIFANNTLPVTDSKILELILFKSYPVGTSVVEYMFARHFDTARLSESAAIFAMAILQISALVVPLVKSTWKNAGAALLYFLSAILVCSGFSPMFWGSVYVDTLLGIVAGTVCFLFIEGKKFSWFNTVLSTILLWFLILIKDSGSGLALIILAIPVCVGIYKIADCILHKKIDDIARHLRYFIPLTVLILRGIHKLSLAETRINYSSQKISLSQLADCFVYEQKGHFGTIWDGFYNRLFLSKMPAVDIPISYFMLAIVLCIAIFVMSTMFDDRRKKLAKAMSLLLFAGFYIYSFTLFVYYVFVFQPEEAQRLASFDRYMATYMIMVFIVLLSLGMCLSEKRRPAVTNILLCMFCVPILNINNWKELFHFFEPIKNLNMTCYDTMDQQLLPYLGKDSKFFIIANSQGLERLVASTRWPNNFHATKCIAWRGRNTKNKYSRPYSDAEIMKLIKDTDYCFVASRTDDFSESYGKYFDDGAKEPFTLYKCDGGKFKKLPLKRFVFDFQKTSLLRFRQRNALAAASLRSHKLNVKIQPNGEVVIFPLPLFCPLHRGVANKIVLFVENIHGDAQWELRGGSKQRYASGTMTSLKNPLVVDLPNVSNFNFTFVVRTSREQTCSFSISRVEVHYYDKPASAPDVPTNPATTKSHLKSPK